MLFKLNFEICIKIDSFVSSIYIKRGILVVRRQNQRSASLGAQLSLTV